MSILDEINRRLLFFDGAMGTMLQKAGLLPGENPDTWCVTHPQDVKDIHKMYLQSGCTVIATNTFGSNTIKLNQLPFSSEELTQAAVTLAKEAIAETQVQAFVALDLGPTGKILYPFGDLSFEEAVQSYVPMIRAGAKAGADLILLETFSDLYEIKAAVLAAKENCDLPIFVSFTPDKNGRLLTGGDVESTAALLQGLGVSAIGMNCGLGPDAMLALMPRLRACTDLPIFINPNAGLPVRMGEETVYTCQPDDFSQTAIALVKAGASGVGGCCGTSPDYTKEIVDKCKDLPFQPHRVSRRMPVVSSYGKAVVLGKVPVVVGERINPTGKPRLKRALQKKDYDVLVSEALHQLDAGAQVIDVNAGVPGIDEGEVLKEVVCKLQSITDTPLQIDTANVQAMEKALRIYNGRPILNSVNGKESSMQEVFPLAKKYGAMLVALLLDEEGIPETVEGRLRIADKILAKARTYGFSKEDILFDPLTLTVSTGQNPASVTLNCVEALKERGCYTILGVSNVSFGLPEREILNTAFLTMAMERGLTAAIMNPLSEKMMDSLRAFCVLKQYDENCASYLSYYAQTEKETKEVNKKDIEKKEELSLYQAILRGLKHKAQETAVEEVKKREVSALLEEELIPALNEVGVRFSDGRMFLPQLLMSADAASAAFSVLREKMHAMGKTAEPKGKILLATVQGDIHDIGKNIAKALLENYNYEVVDLGKDVAPKEILTQVLEQKIPLVGLSALMTTTVPAMEKTVALLHEKAPFCKIMVGGAVLTQDYAKKIGADCYVADAMADVRYAEQVFGK